jgi:heme A synthase
MSSVSSFLLIQYPMDAVQLSHSISGFSHILVALLTAFFIVIAMWLFGYSLKENKNLKAVSEYSFIICMIVLFAGLLTALFALFNMPEYVGFIQKLPIIAFLFWIVMTVYWILRSDKRIHYIATSEKKRKK